MPPFAVGDWSRWQWGSAFWPRLGRCKLRQTCAFAALAAVVAITLSTLCVRFGWRRELRNAAWTGIAGSVVFYAVVMQLVLPGFNALWLARRVAATLEDLGGPRPLLAVGYAEPSLAVLAGAPVQAADANTAAASLAVQTGWLALISNEEMPAFADAARQRGLNVGPQAVVEGLGYTHGRWLVLHLCAVR
jgi:hypothetical protein